MLWLIYSTVNSAKSGEFTGAVKYLIIVSTPYLVPTEKHYQCLHGQHSTANTMANCNNQAEMTLKDDNSVAHLPTTTSPHPLMLKSMS